MHDQCKALDDVKGGVTCKSNIPSDPALKNSEDYKLIGKPIQRLDIPSKTNGSAQFGIDVKLPEMMYATICQSPVFGGEVMSYDEAAAKKIRGVKKVVLTSHFTWTFFALQLVPPSCSR